MFQIQIFKKRRRKKSLSPKLQAWIIGRQKGHLISFMSTQGPAQITTCQSRGLSINRPIRYALNMS